MSTNEVASRQKKPPGSGVTCPIAQEDSANDVRREDNMGELLAHAEQTRSIAETLSTEEDSQERSAIGLKAFPFPFPEFTDGTVDVVGPEKKEAQSWEVEDDSELDLQIELGRTRLEQATVDSLRSGSVVPLDKQAGHSMDVYVDGRLVARGELLVLNEKFCVRITERLAP